MGTQIAGALGFLNGITHTTWFPLLGCFILVYLFLGLFEESFGFGKPLRVIAAIVATYVYKTFGPSIWASICAIFASIGLKS